MTLIFLIYDKTLNVLHATILQYGRIDSNNQKNNQDQKKGLNKIEQYFTTLTLPKKWFKYFYSFGTIWISLIILEILILPATTTTSGVNNYVNLFSKMVNFIDYELPMKFSWVNYLEEEEEYNYYKKQPLSETILAMIMIEIQVLRRFYETLTLFIYGSYHQNILHRILASLRSNQNHSTYSVPKGDWFNYISSPHYFAEILIYVSFVILTKGLIITNWIILIWVVVALSSVAKENEKWGRERFAQTDAPVSQPIVPFNPKRVYKVARYVINSFYENVTGPFLPSIIQYGWHKLSSERIESFTAKNIIYGPRPRNRLDVYVPNRLSTTTLKGHHEENLLFANNNNESPVIIFIGNSWNSGNKATCMPFANNLQNQGYVVGKISEMVSDVQNCIYWTHSHIRQYKGDPSQIYLMGHSAGALISALTVVHNICATLHVLPFNNSSIHLPVFNNNPFKRSELPRIAGLMLFSGVYDVTYYYAYLHNMGLEQVHAMPRVMGNTSESFLQCSPTYLLSKLLSRHDLREQVKMMLPKRVVLIHGENDKFTPTTSTKNFFQLLDSIGMGTSFVQLKIYKDLKYVSPLTDLIVPTKRLCVLLLEDVKECCKGNLGMVMMGGRLSEKKNSDNDDEEEDKGFGEEELDFIDKLYNEKSTKKHQFLGEKIFSSSATVVDTNVKASRRRYW
ncbi:8882_t:CDS:10 [Entrophospora sp. SA101]|nr:8882_t:CDS:10 [Entrophospora sp. SA101]